MVSEEDSVMEMANIQPLYGLYGSQINRENAVDIAENTAHI